MQSVLLPTNMVISISSQFFKREGPRGIFLKKRGDFKFSQIVTTEGSRLFMFGVSSQQESSILALIKKKSIGLTLGYRKRLRLRGIGFRVSNQQIDPKSVGKSVAFPKQFQQANLLEKQSCLIFKLGFSHEIGYPIQDLPQTRKIEASRLDGRTKGTLISIQGNNLVNVASRASSIQSYRYPDVYKGKGIHLDGQILALKKGKRQG